MDRRKQGVRKLTRALPPIDELLKEEIDGETYAIRNEARCRVCSLPDKGLPEGDRVLRLIDRSLVRFAPYKAILRYIQPFMEGWPAKDRPGYASIRNHARRHLRIDETLVREIVERRAAAQDKKILDGIEPLITRAAVLEAVVQTGVADLAAGVIVPKVSDILTASKALEDIDESSAQLQLKRLQEEFELIVQAIREVVAPDVWPEIISRIESLRTKVASEHALVVPNSPAIQEDNNAEEE